MDHDRIHAREPAVDADSWRIGTIRAIDQRDGHCVVTVEEDGQRVELTVTLAIRDLFVSRLNDVEEPLGQQVWFKQRGQ